LISVRRDEDIINWVKENKIGGRSLAGDPAIRDKLAELWIEAQVCRLMTMRSMSLVERGENFTYEGSAEKVWAPEHGVRTTEVISQILGPYAQLLSGSEGAIEDGLFAHNLMGAFQSGINHGSVQVMRDQVARRGLGMPRG
jgi:alkylation response protein AidB-like acyl-CoA dehydrogenase